MRQKNTFIDTRVVKWFLCMHFNSMYKLINKLDCYKPFSSTNTNDIVRKMVWAQTIINNVHPLIPII